MSETVLFGKVKDPELVVWNFWGQLQCRMGGKPEGLIEVYRKFWHLNPVARDKRELLRIPAWSRSFELTKKELETILERDVLPAAVPEFPTKRIITLWMSSPMIVYTFSTRESHGGETAKRIHGRLRSFDHWILGSCVFPHV